MWHLVLPQDCCSCHQRCTLVVGVPGLFPGLPLSGLVWTLSLSWGQSFSSPPCLSVRTVIGILVPTPVPKRAMHGHLQRRCHASNACETSPEQHQAQEKRRMVRTPPCTAVTEEEVDTVNHCGWHSHPAAGKRRIAFGEVDETASLKNATMLGGRQTDLSVASESMEQLTDHSPVIARGGIRAHG